MALPPRLYNAKYHISDTILKRQTNEQGSETFRGSGTDYSEKSDEILYIMSYPLERLVALKAFIESVSYGVSKSVDAKEERDKQDKVVAFMEGDLEIDVTLNMPAHSINEAVNNTAKIEELHRLIKPTSGYRLNPGLEYTKNIIIPMFFVWFKNIISSGSKYFSYIRPQNITADNMVEYGFPCMIDTISYEPDVEAGFFEFNSHRYAKNIKLNLKLTLVQHETKEKRYTIDGFKHNGEYAFGDKGFFPFCVSVGDKPIDEGHKGLSSKAFELTTASMNSLSTILHGGQTLKDYFFISLDIGSDSGQATRYVVLKPFINSFNRTNAVDVRYSDTKNRVGRIVDADEAVTFKEFKYKFNLSVPSEDIAEAKQNCAKVQYLLRMFYRADSSSTSVYDFSDLFDSMNGKTSSLVTRKIRVYSPSFIENAKPTTTSSLSFDKMFDNALDLHFTSFSVEINFDMGFFEENGRLFPKEMTLDFEFVSDSGDLIKSYEIIDEKYYMQPSDKFYEPERFPYKRKTVRLGE